MRVSELYYEELGDDFDRFMSDYDVRQRIQLMNDLLPAQARFDEVLEVGCGTGAITAAFASRAARLTVADISEKLARGVAERHGCSWSAEDACALSFPAERFDLVFSSECIEHTPDPLRAVEEMARVVRPGGLLLLTTPNRLWFPVVWLAMKLKLRSFQGNERFVSPGQVCRVLRARGLEVEAVSGCHLFPWQLPGSQRILPLFDRLGRRLYPAMINFAVLARKAA